MRTLLSILTILFVTAGIYIGINYLKESNIFTVKNIEIKGVINSDKTSLSHISTELMGLNLFDERLNGAIESKDPWIQKIIAKRVLPDTVNLIVYEEKALFKYKDGNNNCFVFTGSGKSMPVECTGVKIYTEGELNKYTGLQFAEVLNSNPFLKDVGNIKLKDYSFEAVIDGDFMKCPYDSNLFVENFNSYQQKVRHRYKKVDYVDITVDKRIYVKGVQNVL